MTAHRSTTVAPAMGDASRAAPVPATGLIRIAEAVASYGLPAFILCLPLEFTSDLLKLQLARIVLLVVALAYAYLVLVGRRKLVLPFSASSIVLLAFVGVSLLSWVLTRAPGSRNELADVALYPVMLVLVVSIPRTDSDHKMAWTALLVSGLAVALIVAFLHFTHLSIWRPDPEGIRVNATFADPNVTARFLTVAAGAGIMLFASRSRHATRLAAVTAAACAAFTSFTLSKSALLIFPVSAVLAGAFAGVRRRGAAAAAAVLLIFGASVLVTPGAAPRVVRAIDQIFGGASVVLNPPNSGPSNATISNSNLDLVRVYLINAGWQMFVDHPLTGVGFGGYQHALTTTYKRFLPANPPATLSHTAAVTLLAEEGLVGGLAFLAFLVLFAREVILALRRPTAWRDWIVIPAVLILPILAFSQVEGRMIEEPYLWLMLGLAYSARVLEGSTRRIELPS